jgi:peptidoglycan hydrolase-like protein with peptidoglycan-binding domain
VKVLQGYLGLASSDQTGFFGDLTEQRVKQFQQAHGLTADGVVGAGTWQRLQR